MADFCPLAKVSPRHIEAYDETKWCWNKRCGWWSTKYDKCCIAVYLEKE